MFSFDFIKVDEGTQGRKVLVVTIISDNRK